MWRGASACGRGPIVGVSVESSGAVRTGIAIANPNDQDAAISFYITKTPVETRAAFDEFITDPRRIQNAIATCDDFKRTIDKLKLDHALEKDELIEAFRKVRDYAQQMLERLAGSDPPAAIDEDDDE